MSERVSIKVTSARELVEAERKRLLDAPNKPDFKEWLGNRTYPLDWMKKQFGETLTEKDGLTYPNGERFNEADCSICGREVDPDEKVIQIKNEEDSIVCNICKYCLKTLINLLAQTSNE